MAENQKLKRFRLCPSGSAGLAPSASIRHEITIHYTSQRPTTPMDAMSSWIFTVANITERVMSKYYLLEMP